MPAGPRCEAFFAEFGPSAIDRRFCIWHEPSAGETRGVVVHVHPFAEEVNKCRRMAALGARALAERGFAVLQVDLLGCGDSAGEFEDAAWTPWIADVVAAAELAYARVARREGGGPDLWLWGTRVGCLVAAAALQRLPRPAHQLFWQPVVNGRQALQQFLRLKTAGALGMGDPKAVLEEVRSDLAAGRAVDVAGYRLSAALSAGLESARVEPAPGQGGRLVWLEVDSRPAPELLPASRSVLAAWQAAGWTCDAAAVAGPPFWSTVEIEDAPLLVRATVERMCAPEPA